MMYQQGLFMFREKIVIAIFRDILKHIWQTIGNSDQDINPQNTCNTANRLMLGFLGALQ